MKIINCFLVLIFCFNSCASPQDVNVKKRILVTHEMIKDFIFWIADDEYEVVSIYGKNQNPFKDAPHEHDLDYRGYGKRPTYRGGDTFDADDEF